MAAGYDMDDEPCIGETMTCAEAVIAGLVILIAVLCTILAVRG